MKQMPWIKIVVFVGVVCLTVGTSAAAAPAKGKPDASKAKPAKAVPPKPPFAVLKSQVPVKPPLAQGFMASCKQGYVFLIAATKEVHKGDKLTPTELDYVVVDSSGKEYQPVAFGLPAKGAPGPFMFNGSSFTESIEIVDVDRTFFGLLFLVPKKAQGFTLRPKSAKTGTRLPVLKDFDSPDAIRTAGFQMYGEIKFGWPTVTEDGWGTK